MNPPIEIYKDALATFCEKHHIVKLALFGSVLTDKFGDESDVDVLIEFDLTRGEKGNADIRTCRKTSCLSSHFFKAVSACNLRPRAPMTFRMVSKLGLRSPESAL